MMAGEMEFGRRPSRLKSGKHRTRTIGARITESEESELTAAAERGGRNVSEWAREVLLREARSLRTDALFTEIVATRMLLNLVLKSVACGEVMTPESFSAVLTKVRMTKHKQALDMMEQYATPDKKES